MSRKDTSRLTEVTILLISSSKVGGLVVIPIPGIISSKFVNVFLWSHIMLNHLPRLSYLIEIFR